MGTSNRSAATASAFSRHPDLAEAPVLDIALEASEGADADDLLSQRRKRTAAATAVFVPLAVTPAVERMLQVRLPHPSNSSDLCPPPQPPPPTHTHTPHPHSPSLVSLQSYGSLPRGFKGSWLTVHLTCLCVCLQCCPIILHGLTRAFGRRSPCPFCALSGQILHAGHLKHCATKKITESSRLQSLVHGVPSQAQVHFGGSWGKVGSWSRE